MRLLINILFVLFSKQLLAQYCLNQDSTFSSKYLFLNIETVRAKSDEIDTFDLVFHVLHRGEPIGFGGNISDAQILSAIVALNRDFRALPIHDSISIRPNGVDTRIHFRAACIDPSGNPTKGITRTNASGILGYDSIGLQFRPQGGGNYSELIALSNWPINRYINVWVAHRIEKPDGAPTGGGGFGPGSFLFQNGQGGVFLNHRYVGCDPDSSKGFQIFNPYGRLISHEIGHFLGLLHTFQGGSCKESDCSKEGDFVCDTEPHTNSQTNDNGCNDTIECGTREPVENIMNYTGIRCGNIFTQGQKNRMKAVIEQHFISLSNQPGCNNLTAINKKTLRDEVAILPNPASEYVMIKSPVPFHVTIVSLGGKVLLEENFDPGENRINTNMLQAGLYVLKLITATESRTIKLQITQ
jgi:hypothetical protein